MVGASADVHLAGRSTARAGQTVQVRQIGERRTLRTVLRTRVEAVQGGEQTATVRRCLRLVTAGSVEQATGRAQVVQQR